MDKDAITRKKIKLMIINYIPAEASVKSKLTVQNFKRSRLSPGMKPVQSGRPVCHRLMRLLLPASQLRASLLKPVSLGVIKICFLLPRNIFSHGVIRAG